MKGVSILEVLLLAPNRHIDAMELLYSFSGVLFLRDNHAMK